MGEATGTVDWDAYVDAMAPAVGLAIAAEWRPGVTRFLGLAAGMAATLAEVELGDDTLELDALLTLPGERA